MEEKKTVAKSEINVVSPSPENVLMVSHARRNLFIILSIAGVVFLSLGTYIYYLLFLQVKTPPLVSRENLTQPSPIPTAAVNAADFVPYNTLSGEEKFSVAYNFSDPILNAGFAYPPGYTLQSLKADEKDKTASLFFISSKNSGQAGEIATLLQCLSENRKEPRGTCRESYTDMEVLIQPFEQGTDEGKYFENGSPSCKKEIDTKQRVLFSCTTPMSDAEEDTGMQYKLYLLGENPVKIEVTTKTPKEDAHLIRSIISSATNHL